MRNREHLPCRRATQEQNDKRVQVSPSQFHPRRVRRCRQSASEITVPSFHMLCAKSSSEHEAVESLEVGLSMIYASNQTLRRAKREKKGLKENQQRCDACVRTKENLVRNRTVSPILRYRGYFSSNVMQFLQDITNVVARSTAGSSIKGMTSPTCR